MRCVLVIAGLDPAGGAGLVADVATVAARGLHPAAVVTALTEQDSGRCHAMAPCEAGLVGRMIHRLVDDLPIAAVKIGMLGSAAVASAVAAALSPLVGRGVPVVLDPVLRASVGVALFTEAATALSGLRPLTTLLTPNRDEAAWLLGHANDQPLSQRAAARALVEQGWGAVLVKGGHFDGDELLDLLDDGSAAPLLLRGVRAPGPTPHGTGCALATEIACALALGAPLRAAVTLAQRRVAARVVGARAIGHGRPFLAPPELG